jgi:hypothetical protein
VQSILLYYGAYFRSKREWKTELCTEANFDPFEIGGEREVLLAYGRDIGMQLSDRFDEVLEKICGNGDCSRPGDR